MRRCSKRSAMRKTDRPPPTSSLVVRGRPAAPTSRPVLAEPRYGVPRSPQPTQSDRAPCMKQVPPKYSPDGAHWWDGTQWRPTGSPDGLWQWDGTRWQPSAAAPNRPPKRFRWRRALVLHLIAGIFIGGVIILVGRGMSLLWFVTLGVGWLIAGCLMIAVGLRAPSPWPAIAQLLPAVWLLLAWGAIVIQLLAASIGPTTPKLNPRLTRFPILRTRSSMAGS
jgi:hypothetical protein